LQTSLYEDRNDDGEKEVVEKRIIDYDFIDAEPLMRDIKLRERELDNFLYS